MEDPGQKLKRLRERLGLRYRDVEELSQKIADRRKDSEFSIAISRLADIENKNVVPSIYRLYTLCAIYRIDMAEALGWYGVSVEDLAKDATGFSPERTHAVKVYPSAFGPASGELQVPLSLDPGIDLKKTTFLSRFIQNWGVLPLMLATRFEPRHYRYAMIGVEDWFMYPILHPGSLVLIDDTKRKIAAGGWTNEFDRPMYLLEHREGWVCGWCHTDGSTLTAIPHPASHQAPIVYTLPADVEVVGQVIGVANRFDLDGRRSPRA
jgi:transcriptional regulator with XRE-family HTH domain